MTMYRVTSRLVNSKRHTVGYNLNGKPHRLEDVVRLASNGRVHGVRVVGEHIQTTSDRNPLFDRLPIRVIPLLERV